MSFDRGVVSSIDFNAANPDVILLAITSQIPKDLAQSEYRLTSGEQRRAGSGLPRPSIVRAAKIVTLSQSLVRKTLGQLPGQTVDQVVDKLLVIIK